MTEPTKRQEELDFYADPENQTPQGPARRRGPWPFGRAAGHGHDRGVLAPTTSGLLGVEAEERAR